MSAKPSASSRPRPGGGFNPGMGFGSEHLDEQAMQQAMGQKSLAQQGAAPSNAPTPQSQNVPTPDTDSSEKASSDIVEGMLLEPLKQVAEDVSEAIGLNRLLSFLGLRQESPEENDKKRQLWQRYQQLDQEQQAYAKQRYEQELQKKQQEEEEHQQQVAAEQAQKDQQVVVPQGTKQGAEGPGGGQSKKQQTAQLMQQQRQSFNSTMSAN